MSGFSAVLGRRRKVAASELSSGKAATGMTSPLLAFVVRAYPESGFLKAELGRSLSSFSGDVRALNGEVRVLVALDPEGGGDRMLVEDALGAIKRECAVAEAMRAAGNGARGADGDTTAAGSAPGKPTPIKGPRGESDNTSNDEGGGSDADDESEIESHLVDELVDYPKGLWRFTPEICSMDRLMERTADCEYVMVVQQGDSMSAEHSSRLLDILRAGDHDIVKTSSKMGEKKARDSHASSYYRPFRALLRSEGVVMRRSRVRDMDIFFGTDRRVTARMVEAVMDTGGYLNAQSVFFLEGPNRSEFDPSLTPWLVEELVAYSLNAFGEVTEYVQHSLASVLHGEIGSGGSKETALKCLEYIDGDTILGHGRYNLHTRLYALSLKHGADVLDEVHVEDDSGVYYGERLLFKISNASRLKICVTTVEDGSITFQGTTDLEMLGYRGRLLVTDGDNGEYPLQISDFHLNNFYGLDGELVLAGRQFKVTVPLRPGMTFGFVYRDEFDRDFEIAPGLLRHSRLDPKNPGRYFVKGGFLVKLRGATFIVEEHTKQTRAKSEAELMGGLLRNRKPKAAAYRALHFAHAAFQRKPIWILADRPQAAKDNAEHLYRYILKTDASRRNDVYFLLNKNYPDYDRVRSYGRVLKFGSLSHKLKFLESSFIISAAANNLATNAFGKSEPCYRDLYDFDFVYLRHGVSHNDQSAWLHKLRKDIRILDATCRPEYEGILEGGYGYTEREVRLTGLPRFDNLRDERQKIISILPTWRENLQGRLLPRTSEREYVAHFKESDYFKFFDALIHDERLLDAMREHGYRGLFYLHPALEAQYVDFESSDLIEVGGGIADYQQIFAESAMMVTDYSSVAFDFAYLKKPVIYAQFDEETFYTSHSWEKGYFTYREDGFGPVTTTLDATVAAMIDYIENDCRMKPEHVEKVEAFFAYTDKNNCKRVLDAIEEVERNRT